MANPDASDPRQPMTPFASETASCRAAHLSWAARPVRDRLAPVREFRHLLVDHADALASAVEADVARRPGEVVATDLLPTAAAAKYLLTDAERLLRPAKPGRRPLWLWDCRDTVYRRPHGLVGLIGTWNYPVFLNAVPLLQAIVAGNGVLWKPSELTPRTAGTIHDLLIRAGVPADLVTLLPATRDAGPQLAEADVDFVHFTGSDAVGRRLAAKLGERLVPSVLELSGVDAVFVLPDADVTLAARSVWYGATLNSGQTCLAPRRAFVHRDRYAEFAEALRPLVASTDPATVRMAGQAEQFGRLVEDATTLGGELVGRGGEPSGSMVLSPTAIFGATPAMAVCREATFSPLVAVLPFDTTDQAVSMHDECGFGLAASVFTADPANVDGWAGRLRVGSVVVNDVIVPTAGPATPFGGRRASGWGSTQGADGLLAMTVPQVVSVRKGTHRPHVDAALAHTPAIDDVTRGSLRFGHGRTVGERWRGLKQMIGGARKLRG